MIIGRRVRNKKTPHDPNFTNNPTIKCNQRLLVICFRLCPVQIRTALERSRFKRPFIRGSTAFVCTDRIRIMCRRCIPQRQLYSQKYVSDIQLLILRSLQPADPSTMLLHIECAASYKRHNNMLLPCFLCPPLTVWTLNVFYHRDVIQICSGWSDMPLYYL